MSATATEPLFSCQDIAREVAKTRGACSNLAVSNALRRIGVVPAFTTASGRCYYGPEVVEVIRENLRAANHSPKPEQ